MDGWTDVHTHRPIFETDFIRSTLSKSRPRNSQDVVFICCTYLFSQYVAVYLTSERRLTVSSWRQPVRPEVQEVVDRG